MISICSLRFKNSKKISAIDDTLSCTKLEHRGIISCCSWFHIVMVFPFLLFSPLHQDAVPHRLPPWQQPHDEEAHHGVSCWWYLVVRVSLLSLLDSRSLWSPLFRFTHGPAPPVFPHKTQNHRITQNA